MPFKKKTRIKTFKKSSMLGLFFTISFLVVVVGLVFGVAVFAYLSKDLPDLKKISAEPMIQSTKIYDRTGTVVLYDVYGEEKRTVVPMEKISQNIQDATISIEDSRFYTHNGIDIRSIFRAILTDILNQKLSQGASTITQQLIKGYFLSPEKTFSRKLKEIVLSLELEQKYSKDEILEFYLNQIPYGANAYGVESASLTFFNKRASDLTIAESALLAALPKAPSYYSPYGSHRDELLARKDHILGRMFSLGFITGDEFTKAKSENVLAGLMSQKKTVKAPHFVMYVKEYLENKYGEDRVLKGGLRVHTTLDWDAQQIAEKIVYESAIKNTKEFNARNATLSAIDVKTGQIIAMVGSYDYFDIKNDGNVNVSLMQRQPGSAFKPFAYAAALEKGFTPETVLFDLPTEFSSYSDVCPPTNIDFSNKNTLCYHPQNYDERFRGPVDLRHSLAQSLNIPSVKTLYLAGIKETVGLAQNMGISTLKKPDDYGLALVLGAAEVKPVEMSLAFSVFANDGLKNDLSSILKIGDSSGKILEEYKPKTKQVLSEQTARQISNILSDNSARAPVFGENNHLHIENFPVAAKTGTTQDYGDAWVIGYSPEISVAVWVGNNNGDKILRSGAGISAAGPIWNKFMRQYTEKHPLKSGFTLPETISTNKDILNGSFEVNKKILIDKISKKIATENTPANFIEEIFFKEVHSILRYIDKTNPHGEPPANPESDPQFLNWEAPILEWVKKQNESGKNYNLQPSTETDNVHTKENEPKIIILSPKDSDVIISEYMSIKTSVLAAFPIKQVDFFIENNLLGSAFKFPYDLMFPVSQIKNLGNNFLALRIVAYDIYGNKKEESINIYLPVF